MDEDDSEEQARMSAIYSRRLREINQRAALPVGDPERADADEINAVKNEDFWS